MKTNKLVALVSTFVTSLAALFFMAAPHAFAATATWTGGGSDTNMNTAGNWGGTAPSAGDDLVFPANITNRVVVNNYAGGTSFHSITFSGAVSTGSSYTISGSAMVVVAGITDSMTGSSFNSQIISAPLTLGGNQTITVTNTNHLIDISAATFSLSTYNLGVAGAGDLMVEGNITGSGTLNKSGTGVLTLIGDNSSYTGAISVTGGQLFGANTNAINTSGGTNIAAGAELSLADCTILTYNGDVTLTGDSVTPSGANETPKLDISKSPCIGGAAFTETYGVVSNNSSVTFTGNITLGSDITFKTDSKDVTLTGNITGAHTIKMIDGYEGKLIINATSNSSNNPNGTYTASATTKTLSDDMSSNVLGIFGRAVITVDGKRSDTTVQGSGAVLMGTGTVGNLTVATNATVAPGHSPGCLTVGAGLVLNGNYQAELGGTTACTGYDQLTVTGTVNVTGATLVTSLYNGFKPAAGDKFTVIDNDAADAVTGTFIGLDEGATFTVSGYVFKISYVGGDGNDVALTVVSVPAVPDTGFTLLHANPYVTLAATIVMTGALSLGFRRLYAVRIKR